MDTDASLPEHIRGLLAEGALGNGRPELVQTHASYVLLTARRAYKLKKPLNLGFLNYSTLARRKAACEAELRLNRRLTRDVYLAVEPVTRTAAGFRIGASADDGEVVDYAVVMRRLPEARMMDRLVARYALTHADVERLAQHLAAFYREAPTGGAIDAAAAPGALLENWQENFRQTLPFVGRTLTPAHYTRIAGAVYRDLVRLQPLWQERIAGGFARDGHGDLRASAICFDEQIQVYDCIEFDERYRYGDVAADIAFLTMDLDSRGQAQLADEFLACYVAASGDATLPAVLPFYRCYRACVRAKVDSLQLDEPEVPAGQRARERRRARYLFQLAAAYARPSAPRIYAVAGADAATRAAVATAVAGRAGAELFSASGEGAYAAIAARLYQRIPCAVMVEDDHRSSWIAELKGTSRTVLLQLEAGHGEDPAATAAEIVRRLGMAPPRPPRDAV